MSTMRTEPKLTRPARVTALVAGLIALVVMIGSIAIVLPEGTPGRAAVSQIADPFFSQNWKVFAPAVMKGNSTLEVRAQWRDDAGSLIESGWIPATIIEQRTVTGNPTPSRTQKLTWNASSTYARRFAALNDTQQTRARDTFIEEVNPGSFRAIPDATLIEQLGPDDGDVIRFLRMDYMLTRYATHLATAALGRPVERVQWRIVTTRANDLTHRFDTVEQSKPTTSQFGWRQASTPIDAATVRDFQNMITRNGGTDDVLQPQTDSE